MTKKMSVVDTLSEFYDDYTKVRMGKREREIALDTLKYLGERFLLYNLISKDEFLRITKQA